MFGRCRADKLFQLRTNQWHISLLVTVSLPEDGTEEYAGRVAEDNLLGSTESDAGVFGIASRTA